MIGRHDDGQPNLLTFSEIFELTGYDKKNSIILKMDIEGYERDVFKFMDTELLQKFDQIVLEIHGLCEEEKYDDILTMLINIEKYHNLIHVHANNSSPITYLGNHLISDTLELTFVNKKKYKINSQFQDIGKESLDYRNYYNRPDRLFL